ncbi:phospholipase D P1 [Prunus dulcis]|uniref:Phospholipase n=1 Tax=Prunus dulcis TaxID=3755 RepID=A0A4Y1RQ81_PRUDU|nr:phospholipase D P1 [Prunus dulcis]
MPKVIQLLFKWRLLKKASQVLYLHFALRKRAIIEEFHEKQEQTAVVQDDDEPDDGAVPVQNEESVRNRYVPSRAALPILRPALGGQQSISDRAKVAMQGYLNHFLGNMDLVNSREVCKFLEVSKLSFSQEYGPKLKEGYVMVKHLPKIAGADSDVNSFASLCLGFCSNNWQKGMVWAVLKPGFLALLEDPFDTELLDIIVFNVLPTSNENACSQIYLANQIKERNPLRYTLRVASGNQSLRLRTTSNAKVKDWVAAINDAGLRPHEGWCHPHRFGSFAPPRGLTDDGSQAQWFVDGQAAFEAIASSVEAAKSEIFITGWWLCPELYLRRPFHSNSSSRLDALLYDKARQGVQIYILLYKEVALALKINSSYSKKLLSNIHENICFIGGLDLCFGRYDTVEHKVGDCPPHIWPGKDYYNPRESEPNSWEDTMKDELEREISAYARNKAPNEQTIPLLMPQHHMVIPHYMGRSREIDVEKKNKEETLNSFSPSQDIPLLLPQEADGLNAPIVDKKPSALDLNHNLLDQPTDDLYADMQMEGFVDDLHSMDLKSETNLNMVAQSGLTTSNEGLESPEEHDHAVAADDYGQIGPRTACHCQVVRSVSQWSAGSSQAEDSIHKAYCSLIEKAEHFVYIENQFFISGLSGDEIIQNRVLEALYRRIKLAHKEQKCFRVIVVIPLLPGFQGGVDDGGAATVRALMHWQYRTISWEKHSILHNLKVLLGPKTHDYISFYGLRTYGRLFEGGPVSTSQVYVHSKVMIIDDCVALIGSSNINDRSLIGSRDSEIGVVIEDKEFLESSMNGLPWKAGKFAYSLRCSLWSEHLGLHAGEKVGKLKEPASGYKFRINQISDPVSDTTYKDLWLATAKENSIIYQDVFSCIPNDSIHSRAALRQCMAHQKEKLGHTTIDLGIAPEKIQSCENGEVKETDPMERLKHN